MVKGYAHATLLFVGFVIHLRNVFDLVDLDGHEHLSVLLFYESVVELEEGVIQNKDELALPLQICVWLDHSIAFLREDQLPDQKDRTSLNTLN